MPRFAHPLLERADAAFTNLGVLWRIVFRVLGKVAMGARDRDFFWEVQR